MVKAAAPGKASFRSIPVKQYDPAVRQRLTLSLKAMEMFDN